MKLFEKLNKEIHNKPNSTYAPFYYRFLGYKKDFSASSPIFHANGISSLFTETTPVILKNELIIGNTFSLFSDENSTVLNYSKQMVEQIGKRFFITNKDHFAPNYKHILSVGICGLIEEINISLYKYKNEPKKCETLNGMRITLEAFLQMIKNYALAAEKCKNDISFNSEHLDFIISNCNKLITDKPSTFAEALRLVWFCHTAFLMEERKAMAFGRMDQYLYPFYKKDIESGALTDSRAIDLLENVFIKLQDDTVNILIGGQNINGDCEINPLSRCILYAVKSCNIPGPNLSIRVTENTPDEFLDECLKSIGTGLGYPALMNDDVNIAALKKYSYDPEDIYNYSMVGCIENFITGMQPPWTDGRFDAPRFLDYVFNNGISETNASVGIVTQNINTMKTMKEFMSAFEKQLEYGVSEYCAIFQSNNN